MHSIEQQSVQRRRGVRVKLLDHLRPSFPNHRRLRHVKSSILMICFLRYAQAMSINRIAFYHLETLLWIARSEEHTSELQSLMRISYAVFCLQQKKKHQTQTLINSTSTTTYSYTCLYYLQL